MNSQPEIIAHRGGLWPEMSENTLDAFTMSYRAGIQWMETDVHSSADGILFAAHDSDLQRIAARPGQIRDLRAVELESVELVAGGRLPRLSDLFEALPQVCWNIDVKAGHSVAATIRTVRKQGVEARVRLASFDSSTLRRLRLGLPGVRTSAGILEAALFKFGLSTQLPQGVDALQVPTDFKGFPVVTRRLIDRAHRAGLHVHVWTINEAESMRDLFDMGVDGIVTDEIMLAVNELARHCGTRE